MMYYDYVTLNSTTWTSCMQVRYHHLAGVTLPLPPIPQHCIKEEALLSLMNDILS